MSALHWIFALTLALVCCLSAQPVKQNNIVKNLLKELNHLKSMTEQKCPKEALLNTKLYSPININKSCLSSALNCTLGELLVLESDCNFTRNGNDDFNAFYDFYTNLKGEPWKISTSSTCTCEELGDQTDVMKFLNNIENLVQQLASSSV